MENLDLRAAVNKLTKVLRKTTRMFQLLPFVYLFLYTICCLSELILPDSLLSSLESVVLISPAGTLVFLVMSRLLELCSWHKTACLVPVSSTAVDYIDGFLLTFTEQEITIINTMTGVFSALFLILAYLHFFTDGCKNARKSHA